MKILKIKAFCLIEHGQDLTELPDLHKTKKEVIESSRSYHGHPCDNPLKRGAVCEVEIRVKVRQMPPLTEDLRDYVIMYEGHPALLDGEDSPRARRFNREAVKEAKNEQRKRLKRLGA